MKKAWEGIGEVILDIIGWIVIVAIVLSIVGLLASIGTVLIAVVVALVVVGLLVGGIRRLFGLKKKRNLIEVQVKDGDKTKKYGV